MIICIIGKTNSGKDTVANYLHEKYGIELVCSYTTRPKRPQETNGVEHYFVSKEEFDKIIKQDDVLAYTINDKTGIEYAGTLQSIKSDTCIYIINPEGLVWMKEHFPDQVIVSLYVYLDDETILKRGELRGDNIDVLNQRLSSEKQEFDSFYASGKFDFVISNTRSKEELLKGADLFYKAHIEYKRRFLECYNKVFDENGAMKPCGRDACIDLLDVVYKYNDGDFGNKKTGQLNVDEIVKLRKQL